MKLETIHATVQGIIDGTASLAKIHRPSAYNQHFEMFARMLDELKNQAATEFAHISIPDNTPRVTTDFDGEGYLSSEQITQLHRRAITVKEILGSLIRPSAVVCDIPMLNTGESAFKRALIETKAAVATRAFKLLEAASGAVGMLLVAPYLSWDEKMIDAFRTTGSGAIGLAIGCLLWFIGEMFRAPLRQRAEARKAFSELRRQMAAGN